MMYFLCCQLLPKINEYCFFFDKILKFKREKLGFRNFRNIF